jgi:hypothetical protein
LDEPQYTTSMQEEEEWQDMTSSRSRGGRSRSRRCRSISISISIRAVLLAGAGDALLVVGMIGAAEEGTTAGGLVGGAVLAV